MQQTLSYEKRRDQERDEEAEVRRMERDARKERYDGLHARWTMLGRFFTKDNPKILVVRKKKSIRFIELPFCRILTDLCVLRIATLSDDDTPQQVAK